MNDTGYREGQTATDPKTGQRVIFKGGQWVSHGPARQQRAETTEQDRKALNEASERARIERDVQRVYTDAEKAVTSFDTGPTKAWWTDAITPDEDDGFWGTIGSVIGTPFRPLVSDKTIQARDQLKTVNARTAIAASAQLKGVASDRDMGLLRLTGLKDSKTVGENRRIIAEARLNSALEQYRAKQKAKWVARYGSLAAPAPSGKSFEEISQLAEDTFIREYRRRLAQPQGGKKLPKAPPSARKGSQVTIDINGNPIR